MKWFKMLWDKLFKQDEDKKLRRSTLIALNNLVGQSLMVPAMRGYCIRECMKQTKATQVRRIRKMKTDGKNPTMKRLLSVYEEKRIKDGYLKLGIGPEILEELTRQALSEVK